MSRPVTLFTGQWADLPLETLAQKVSEWGFDGLELACWGDHFEVDKALESDSYVRAKRDLLEKYGLGCWSISNHLVGQCVCDPIDARHKSILPPYVWGDGDPEGVRQRAAQEMINTAKAAKLFGVDVVNGFTGSSVWAKLYFFPPTSQKDIDAGYADFEDFLARFPKIDAVWAQDDDITVGVIEALRQAGRENEMFVVGGAGMKEMIKRVLDGDRLVPVDVLYPPAMIYTAMEVTALHFMSDAPMLGNYILDATLITPENAARYYFPDSPF